MLGSPVQLWLCPPLWPPPWKTAVGLAMFRGGHATARGRFHSLAVHSQPPAHYVAAMLAPETGAFWSRPKRVLFRFVFVYLLLYLLPFPLDLIPQAEPAVKGFETGSNAALAWFGK